MKKVLLIIVSAMACLHAQAQDDTSSLWAKRTHMMHSGEVGHFGYVSAGFQYTQFTGISDQVKTAFGDNFNINSGGFTMSANGYKICHKMLFGGEIGGTMAEATNDANLSTDIYQGFIYANWGYLIYDKKEWMIYPFIGFGGSMNGLTIKNKTATDWPFTQYDIKAGQKGNFSGSGIGINAGFGFKKSVMPCGTGYALQLGFDVGVRYMPYHSNWYYKGNDEKADFGTGENIAYYAKLTIGRGTVKK